MKVGFIAGLMVMALAGSAAASEPVRVITDQSGDANFLANDPGPVTVEASTPASVASMDIVDVTMRRDANAVIVRFDLSAPPATTGPPVMYTLTSFAGPCPTIYTVLTGSVNATATPTIQGVIDNRPCVGGFTSDGVTATADGSSIVLRMPFSALHTAGAPWAPGQTFGGLTAESRIATFVEVSSTNTQVDAFLTEPVGPLVDATDKGDDYTIPEADPAS